MVQGSEMKDRPAERPGDASPSSTKPFQPTRRNPTLGDTKKSIAEEGEEEEDESILVDGPFTGKIDAVAAASSVAMAASDLVAGDRLLFRKKEGVTSATRMLSSRWLQTSRAPHSPHSSPRERTASFLQDTITQVEALPGSGVQGDGSPEGEWELGWLVGRVPAPSRAAPQAHRWEGGDDVLLLSTSPLAAPLLRRVRAVLGLSKPTQAAPATRQPLLDARESASPPCDGSIGTADDRDGVLLSPMREADVSDSDEADDAQQAITLELLVHEAASADKRSSNEEEEESFRPLALVGCRGVDAQPVPHGDLSRMERLACVSDAAADAAFHFCLQQHASQGSSSSFLCLQDTGVCEGASAAHTARQSTWAWRSHGGPGEAIHAASSWTKFLRSAKSAVAARGVPATVVWLPDPGVKASSPLLSLQHCFASPPERGGTCLLGPRTSACLRLFSFLMPLEDIGFAVDLAVPRDEEDESPMEARDVSLLPDAVVAAAHANAGRFLSRLAVTARQELDGENKRSHGSSASSSSAAVWSFSALVERLCQSAASHTQAPPRGVVAQLLQCLRGMCASGKDALGHTVAHAKAVLGLSCLAAAVGPQERWYLSEAEQLFGCRLSGHDVTALLPFLVASLVASLTALLRVQDASHDALSLRLVQLPRQTATPNFFSDVVHEAVRHRVLSHGLCRRVRQEARVEGVWDSLVGHSFAPYWEDPEDDAAMPRTCPMEAVYAVLEETLQSCLALSVSDAHGVTRRFCEGLVMSTQLSDVRFAATGRELQVRWLGGAFVSYSLEELLRPVACVVAGLSSPLLREGGSGNSAIRVMLRTGARTTLHGGAAFRQWLSGAEDTLTVVELPSRDGVASDASRDALLRIFRMASQAYTQCFPIRACITALLSLAVRFHCCCCCGPHGASDATACVFRAPAPHRRSLYIRFLQLIAQARHRDACNLCVREVPAARGLMVGVSFVFAKLEHIHRLQEVRDRVLGAAARCLQQVGRGLLARRLVGGTLLSAARRARQRHLVGAQLASNMATYAARDRERATIVGETAARAAALLAQASAQISEQAERCGALWADTATMVEQELTLAADEISEFESAMAAAEHEARFRIRSFRALLTDEWNRQALGKEVLRVSHSATGGKAVRSASEKQQRVAEALVAECLERQRAAELRRRADRLTATHLTHRQEQFIDYALRRDERADYESRVMSLGSAEMDRSEASRSRKETQYHADTQGLLQTGGKARRRGERVMNESFRDASVFDAQREQLSLWEESTMHAELGIR